MGKPQIMSIAQAVLEKLRALPLDKQQEILDFTEFLYQKFQQSGEMQSFSQSGSAEEFGAELSDSETTYVPKTPLGQQLWELRQQAIASGIKLLSAEEIEAEIVEQRNRHQDLYENLP